MEVREQEVREMAAMPAHLMRGSLEGGLVLIAAQGIVGPVGRLVSRAVRAKVGS
jgi:hypothetical protein